MLHLHQVANPASRTIRSGAILLVFVQPMRCNADGRHLLHFFSADLDLDRNAVHANQGGMQGLIAIGLGDGDVVFEAADPGFIEAMHGP